MPNTGRIKFFERSKLLNNEGADAMSNTGGTSIENIISFDRFNYWQSDDQRDGEESRISILFRNLTRVNRLLIVDTNIKDINISFNRSMTNIVDIDNLEVSSVSPYRNRAKVIYLEFDPIEVISLNLSFSNTIIPNERKYIRQVIATNEIGVFEGYPEIQSFNEEPNVITHRASTGVKNIIKQIRTIDSFNLRFRTYPVESDIALSDKLFGWNEKSFTLWPCGGGYGSDHFLFEKEGWRLQDIYNVSINGMKSHRWWRSFYKSGINTSLRLVEVI